MINEDIKKDIIYLAAYGIIKNMLEKKIITKEAFYRLNIKIAEEQSCKPIET